jgi:hypothetical protein
MRALRAFVVARLTWQVRLTLMNLTEVTPAQNGRSPTGIFADLDALRLTTDQAVGVQEITNTIPVRKPSRQEFFRVHPDETMSLTTMVFEDKDSREFFFVAPQMRDALLGESRAALLVPAMTRQGVLMIWPILLPNDGSKRDSWSESRLEAVHHGKTGWVRIVADMHLGAYRLFRAEGDLPGPTWPDKALGELLDVAFRDRVIDSLDHPVVRRLRGLA